MKANVPRSYGSLPRGEQEKIKSMAYEIAKEQYGHDVMLIMDQLIKMICLTLHTTFGFGEKRLNYLIGNLRRTFSRCIKYNNEGRMLEYLNGQILHLFRKDGYPDEFFKTIFADWTVNTTIKGDTSND